jgi:hypothetical protein
MSDGLPVNPTTTVKPTLKTIFRYGFLAAFNAHDGDTLMSYISPNIKVSRLSSLLSPHTDSLCHPLYVGIRHSRWPDSHDGCEIQVRLGIAMILCSPNMASSLQVVYWVDERTMFTRCIPLVEFLVKGMRLPHYSFGMGRAKCGWVT